MDDTGQLALVLTGGGARAAYQIGVLRHLASRHPGIAPGILTGVSAGGIMAAALAARGGAFPDAVRELAASWQALRIDDVFRVDTKDLASRVMRWGTRLLSGGAPAPQARSLVDTAPLRDTLRRTYHAGADGAIAGIGRNVEAGVLRAVALTASSYTSGRSVTWVQCRAGAGLEPWSRPQRVSRLCPLTVEHVMASAALPFLFPAIHVDGEWFGDGGIRLVAPLSPAIHLGARKILAVSTRYARWSEDRATMAPPIYPTPAQVAGVLLNAIFLDLLDSDALRLQQFNTFLDQLPARRRHGMRHVDLLVLRPSEDLGRLANEFEATLPRAFRFLVRGLGSRDVRSNDMLSLVMFQHDYIARLMALGEADAAARADEIAAFLGA
ncbi:MAG: patatin-like phospholipase family protein [Vicinamibacterales bacterium]